MDTWVGSERFEAIAVFRICLDGDKNANSSSDGSFRGVHHAIVGHPLLMVAASTQIQLGESRVREFGAGFRSAWQPFGPRSIADDSTSKTQGAAVRHRANEIAFQEEWLTTTEDDKLQARKGCDRFGDPGPYRFEVELAGQTRAGFEAALRAFGRTPVCANDREAGWRSDKVHGASPWTRYASVFSLAVQPINSKSGLRDYSVGGRRPRPRMP